MLDLNRLKPYIALMRLDKPIGLFLLLWPTLWAIWLASDGKPDTWIVIVFLCGVILMRSAGCIMNDLADRHVDGWVERTRLRPLVTGAVSVKSAIYLMMVLVGLAFALVCTLNSFTIVLSFVGAGLALLYPFLKRVTHLPQLGLGAAFAWGVMMAFAAIQQHIPASAVLVFITAWVWPVIYDTQYAMVDREDDLRAGIRSTAILFGKADVPILVALQVVFLALLISVGRVFSLSMYFYLAVVIVALLFVYQFYLMQKATREAYFAAFLNHNPVGCVIFLGIFMSKLL